MCCTALLARVPIFMVLEGLAITADILGELPPFQKPNRLDLGSQLVRRGGFLGSGSKKILLDWTGDPP